MSIDSFKFLSWQNTVLHVDLLRYSIMHLDDKDMLRFEMTDGFKAAVKKDR